MQTGSGPFTSLPHPMRISYYFLSTLVLSLLVACGGGGGGDGGGIAALAALGSAGASPVAATGTGTGTGAGAVKTLIAVSAEAPGTRCVNGGTRVDAGLDSDGNGLLSGGEITSSQYVCHGADGTPGSTGPAGPAGTAGRDGVNTLVRMRDESAGSHCAAGGKAIDVGLDLNANDALDAPDEILSTGYVCNGADGAAGQTGATGQTGPAGLDTLMRIANEPAGTNCVHGGKKIETGLDDDPPDGQLDASEITATNYVCNGAAVDWVNVTGTSVQAEANGGYVASNDAAQVVVTLPNDPAIGSVVRVSGAGLGGWRIAQNAGQAIQTMNIGGMGAIWRSVTSQTMSWSSVASSADGSKLVAAVLNGPIYTSTDGGATWTPRDATRRWSSVASSADGNRLMAAVEGDRIYISKDAGATWEPRMADAPRNWVSVASSADGMRLVAAAYLGQLYTSDDGGETWTPRETDRVWASVASSADGSKLVAADAGYSGGWIYTSTNGGEDWNFSALERSWQWVASSADGTKLVAVEYGGRIYTSSDSGGNWTPRESERNWYSVASSADGTKLAAVVDGGRIYTSSDGGVNWAEHESTRSWSSVAVSADGSKLISSARNGLIYTSTASTTPGTGGSITGTRYDTIELQYVGNGMFTVLSHEGHLTIQ